MFDLLCSAAPISSRQSDRDEMPITIGNQCRQGGDTGGRIGLCSESQQFKLLNSANFLLCHALSSFQMGKGDGETSPSPSQIGQGSLTSGSVVPKTSSSIVVTSASVAISIPASLAFSSSV